MNATAADGKNPLGMAIYNGHFELASFLIDNDADVNHADAEGFPPLFWAVDRRNMEWSPGFPWTETTDPLPLIEDLLDAGADPNTFVNNTPRSRRNFGGSPRILFATSLMRAAYSGDPELVGLLLSYGADPLVRNSETRHRSWPLQDTRGSMATVREELPENGSRPSNCWWKLGPM